MKMKTLMAACVIAGSAMADTTLVYQDQNGAESSRMLLSDGWVKMEQKSEGDTAMIFDAKAQAFLILNHADQTYMRFGQKEIEALSDVSAMVDKMLEEQLAQMPAAQREQMRGMMKNMIQSQMPKPKPTPTYAKNGAEQKHNGFACDVVIKTSEGQIEDQFCVTDRSQLGISTGEYQAVESFMAVAEKMASQFGQDQSMNFSAIGEVVPVYYEMGSVKGILSEVSHDELAAHTFQVPQGYKEQALPKMF